jgi:hypothetical protein
MSRRTAVVVILFVIIAAATVWAIVLESGGNHADAVAWVKEAGAGIAIMAAIAVLLEIL